MSVNIVVLKHLIVTIAFENSCGRCIPRDMFDILYHIFFTIQVSEITSACIGYIGFNVTQSFNVMDIAILVMDIE
jgi:hypothetical protein